LDRLLHVPRARSGAVFAEYTDPYIQEGIDSMFDGAIEKLRKDLVVFGRVDDDQPWRIGLYGVDDGGDQLVVDWRARFAERFYQASFDDPMELTRRVSYVGCIDDLFIEDFTAGEVAGTSPLLAELSKTRGSTMRAAVATLQREQDRLVRVDPRERLVVRGGPGTGKTVVGLHRAAWLVYNDRRLTSEKILVIGPSDRYLRFVSAVLPTLGEATIKQTTFSALLGPSTAAGSDERWLAVLDALEASMLRPAPVTVGRKVIPEADVADAMEAASGRRLPWRDRREQFLIGLRRLLALDPDRDVPRRELAEASRRVWPACSARQAWAKLRSRRGLLSLGADRDLVDPWLAEDGDGALYDEVRYRFEGVPMKYSHVMVDEAQDLSLLQLRAVMRRSDGLTLVGDDAQRSNPHGIGLARVAEVAGAPEHVLATAYRMSAEIAAWLNDWAHADGIDAVELLGIRPTGVPVTTSADADSALRRLRREWPNVTSISAGDVWDHKGVEYDGVVVDARDMTAAEVYLAASRAAHELVLVGL
jgi:hypothetical protein